MTEQKFLQDLEKKLWKTADTLRSNISAAEYKHIVLGLVFLKYVSDSFETRRQELITEFTNPISDYYLCDDVEDGLIKEELENRDYYTEKNVFWVPQSARWQYLQDNAGLSLGAKLPDETEFKGIGKFIDDAMDIIEKENPKLKRILNKNYAKLDIDPSKLVALVNLIATIPFTHNSLKAKDILGHVYEYFLGNFAAAEGQRGGQFYTPKSIVNLIVQMIEPYSGRIYDPAMGSGGFFISSEKFIEAHNGRIGDISVYGQESNPTTWRLAAMNMAIRGIDFNFGKEPRSSFTNDQHPDLRADFVLANPPFNQKEEDWWDASLENDARWKGYPTPPKGNANFAWMLHMLHHTNPTNGVVGLVLANGSLSSTTNNEGEIRKAIVQNDLLEAIIALPSQLFANTQIPACIWILNKNKKQKGKTLFIDTRNFGFMIDRKQRDFSTDDIKSIAEMFHHFRTNPNFENIAGKYYSATIEEIAKQEYILTPGRYVGTEQVEDDGLPFGLNIAVFNKYLENSTKQHNQLNAEISNSLKQAFPHFKWDSLVYSSNEILEKLAQTIFKSWFVDFDPVHAKANCTDEAELENIAKDLGISKKILDLFPSEFEESELGMIPKGWAVKTLEDIVSIIDCLHSKKPLQIDLDTGNILLQLNNIQDDGLLNLNNAYYISNEDYQKWISRIEVTKNDFVITNVGRVGAVARIPSDLKAAIGRNMTALRPKEEFKYVSYIHTVLTSKYMQEEINRKMDVGTILNALNVKNIPKLRIIIASIEIMNLFESVVASIQNKREFNQNEIQTLEKTRDTLLPKLLSGEIDVSDL